MTKGMGIQEFIGKLEGLWKKLNEVESEEWVREVRRYEPRELQDIWDWIRRNYSANTLPKPGMCYRAALELGFVEERQFQTVQASSCGKCHRGWLRRQEVREGYGLICFLVACDCDSGLVRARIKRPEGSNDYVSGASSMLTPTAVK